MRGKQLPPDDIGFLHLLEGIEGIERECFRRSGDGLKIDPGVGDIQPVAGMHYRELKLLPRAFASKFELLVDEKKYFRRRGGRTSRFFGLCKHDRNVRQQ